MIGFQKGRIFSLCRASSPSIVFRKSLNRSTSDVCVTLTHSSRAAKHSEGQKTVFDLQVIPLPCTSLLNAHFGDDKYDSTILCSLDS